MAKTLKEIAFSPSRIIDDSILKFKSRNIISILVEGKKDNFVLKSIFNEENVNFPYCLGKPNVIECFDFLNKKRIKNTQGIFFLIDVDFDFIFNKIIKDDKIIYSFLCNDSNKFYFNDLESFIIHHADSNALDKIIINCEPFSNFDVSTIKEKLLNFSKILGSYRAADEKTKSNKISILDGIDLFEFIKFEDNPEWNMIFNEEELRKRLEISSPRKLDIDDLFHEAKNLFNKHSSLELSHGHDLCRLIKYFLINNTNGLLLQKYSKSANDVEMMIRLGIDKNCFLESNVGKKILNILS